jgi:hypothetical protein
MIIVVHLIYYHHYSIALHVVADVVLHHNYFVNIKFTNMQVITITTEAYQQLINKIDAIEGSIKRISKNSN